MHHAGTLQLFQYWTGKRQQSRPPLRSEIAPAAISNLLGNTFILEESDSGITFRLAGTKLCAAFGRELRGMALVNLFSPKDRQISAKALQATITGNTIIVGEVIARTAGEKQVEMELLLMPLADEQTRMLGSLQFFDNPYWLGTTLIRSLELVTLAHANPDSHLASLANRPPIMMPQPSTDQKHAKIWHVLEGGALDTDGPTSQRPALSLIRGGLETGRQR
ncbi:MAG: PAS domain-containing protein [Pseudomonadota bacterium]